jgi:hypothetical protein
MEKTVVDEKSSFRTLVQRKYMPSFVLLLVLYKKSILPQENYVDEKFSVCMKTVSVSAFRSGEKSID